MANNDGEALKTAFMMKRSQLKSKFKVANYKSRWFVLTSKFLRYHDGSLEQGQGREKGRVSLKEVKMVEFADEEALGNRPNAFQVVYKNTASDYETFTLYIVALHSEQRKEWIDTIRTTCDKCNVKWNPHYHPGVWMSRQNKYSCCENIHKSSNGCTESSYKPMSSSQGLQSNGPSLTYNRPDTNSSIDTSPQQPIRNLPPVPTPRPNREAQSIPHKKKVIAIYEYSKAEDTDLDLVVGEEYIILDENRQFWWKAQSQNGDVGYIPSNYVEPVTDQGLEKYGWYYKNCSRIASEEILKREKREGCFLVRDSSQAGMYTLSLYTQEVQRNGKCVVHYQVQKDSEGWFYVADKHKFLTIPDLIVYHKYNPGGLVVRLRNSPLDREGSVPTTAGFGHDKWEIDPDEIEVSEVLGSGQFGTVRKGIWRKHKEVAVKEMQTGSMKEDDFIEEARTMMQFQHTNLVQLYGVCTKRKPIYIVIEYMKYGALQQYLRRRKSALLRDIAQLTDMCVQVCDAMSYLESRQFIHRDLAARNCLVGENRKVKVGDFGLARYVLDDEYTSSSGTKFPVKWAPPEVLSFTKFSSKSDVWAFGVLMWEIWTGGDMPYGKMRNPEVVEHVCHSNGKLPQPPACPLEVYDVMKDCWRKTPENRPAFVDLLESLKQFQEERDYAG